MTFAEFYEKNRDDIEALLIDVDGTLCVGHNGIGNSNVFLQTLRDEGKPFLVLTNDSSRSVREKCYMLECAGIKVYEDELVSCADAFKSVLLQENCRGKRFFAMTKLGNPCFAKIANLDITYDVDEIFECDGIISGEGVFDWQIAIEAVLSYFIHKPDKPFLVANPDSIWPKKGGNFYGVGSGGIARMIVNLVKEKGIDLKPTYLGKPYISIYKYAFEQLAKRANKEVKDLNLEKIYAIGDSLSSDIAGANNANLTSVLVLSGITTMDNVESEKDLIKKPNLIFDTIA